MNKLVLFTFDYELFLGNKSGTVAECLIIPTNKLLQLLETAGFKAVFFIDTIYLLRLEEISKDYKLARDDFRNITEQIKLICKKGHNIFPHIHPHWKDAKYIPEINEWSISNTRYYRFSDIPGDIQDDYFKYSVNFINKFLPTGSEYLTDSYRAGGWCIQPFENFRPRFMKHHIRHDWSVIPGRYQFSNAHYFDFKQAPVDKPVYKFSRNVCVEDQYGEFTEWTISSLEFTPFEKWIDFKINGLKQRLFGRTEYKGATVNAEVKEEGDSLANSKQIRIIASLEGLNIIRLKKYIKKIKKDNYFQFISHPKLLSKFDFTLISKLFKSLQKVKNIQTDFRKL